jgi:hypothetical protein
MSSLYTLAQLANARASGAKAEYAKFIEWSKHADPDMPALVAAKNEFLNL